MRRVLLIALPALVALHQAGCTQGAEGTHATGSGGGSAASSTVGPGSGGASVSSAASTTASASASSAESSSVASSSSAASTGSGPMAENCTNGVDDDGNGKIDCADPACAAYGCVPGAPSGWNGPVALYDGDPAMVPPCPAEHPVAAYQGHGGLLAQPAVCGACGCAAPPVSCTPAALTFTSDPACGTAQGTAVQPAPGQCGPIVPPAGTQGFTAVTPTPLAGACAPTGGGKVIPPAAWSRAALACLGGGLGGGCGPGAFCSATPAAPFVPALCVYRSGDVACPPGFADKHLFVDSIADTRDCGACSCGAPAVDCAATTKVFSGGGCSGAAVAVVNDGSCTTAAGSAASIQVAVIATGSCTPGGGQPTGMIVEGAQKTTACCAQ